MKRMLQSALLLGALSFFTFSCSSDDEEGPAGPKPIEKEVEEIVKELEKVPEVSKFTEELKKIDVVGIESEALTVFAVRDDAFETAATGVAPTKAGGLTASEIKRHVVKGAYEPAALTDSLLLTSITGESLLVTRTADKIRINHVTVETNGVKVGKSVIYEVPKVIPPLEEIDNPIVRSFETIVRVYRCNRNWSPENPEAGTLQPGVKIEFYSYRQDAGGESSGLGDLIYSDLSKEDGTVRLLHSAENVAFRAVPDDSLTDLYDGYVVEGVFTSQAEIDAWPRYAAVAPVPGDLKFADLNGDGLIDSNDRVKEAPARPVAYRQTPSDTAYTKEFSIYLVPTGEAIDWPAYADETIESWLRGFYQYLQVYRQADYDLTVGATEEFYSDVRLKKLSADLWNGAYSLIRKQLDANEKLTSSECPVSVKRRWEEACSQIRTETAHLYSMLINLYGGAYVPGPDDSSYRTWGTAAVFDYMQEAENAIDPACGGRAATALQARLKLNERSKEGYQAARDACKKVIVSGAYGLLGQDSYAFNSAWNAEVVWGGYLEPSGSVLRKGAYFHTVRYPEILLIQAEACMELGNTVEAMEMVNQLLERDGREPVVVPETAEIRKILVDLWGTLLANEGLNYVNLRRWGTFAGYLSEKGISVAAYKSLLPIPEAVVAASGGAIPQNPGY